MFKLLVALFSFTFIGGELLRFQWGNGVSFRMFDAMVAVTVLLWFLIIIRSKKKFPIQSSLVKPIGIFLLVAILSLIVAAFQLTGSQLLISSLYFVRWCIYMLIFFMIRSLSTNNKNIIKQGVYYTGLLLVGVGYIQYFFYNSLRNLYYLGWDDHLYRMFSTVLDPNYAGTIFVLYFLYQLYDISLHKIFPLKHEIVIKGLLACSTLVAIFLTYSRGALIMLLVGVFLFLYYQGFKKTLIFFGIVFLFLFFAVSDFTVEGRNPLRIMSSSERIKSAGNAIAIIQKNPIIGVGFNAYRYAQNRYGFRQSEKWEESHADGGTDNSFLFVFATTGIVGFIAYLNIYRAVFLALRKNKKKSGMRILLIASLCGLIVNSLFLNVLFYPLTMAWMWILLGLSDYV